jgi:2-dehydro-3-deoxyphosphogluconate aldolase/(4S)-4-hydroxy-2-oxoglutarate aldolase
MAMQATPITEILAMGPVMPVIVINEAKNSVALADALFAGGLKTIEITLRTPAA